MAVHVKTVAFFGVEVLDIDVQVQVANGAVGMTIVGLPDKAVGESRERVRAAFHALGLALPAKRITVNLAPADVLKEGSHFDLPIAVGLLAALDVLPREELEDYLVLGELGLDGAVAPVVGVLPAAIAANAQGLGLICPAKQGAEARWAGDFPILATPSLLHLLNHFKGIQVLPSPEEGVLEDENDPRDLKEIKGQHIAKRALEVTAAGGHNLLMIGPPGSGKSMLAARLPSLLPPLEPAEALAVSMIHSVAGQLQDGCLLRRRPFRDPHHSASTPALIGGGLRARPGEVSLAHMGVLFLDELPEFARGTLEALRQPLETGFAVVARANAHVRYPARFQLVAAMNPCRCGYLGDPEQACSRAPKCGADYQARISGPLFDRIDLHVDVPAVSASDLALPPPSESSADVAARVQLARDRQRKRFAALDLSLTCNAEADGAVLETIAPLDSAGQAVLTTAAERMRLTARGYHRILRVARTLADLNQSDKVHDHHIKDALFWRRLNPARG